MTTDPEARFLELAAQPGMERLKRTIQDGEDTYHYGPLPVPERLDALVKLALEQEVEVDFARLGSNRVRVLAEWPGGKLLQGKGPTHWAALTEALLAATEPKKQPQPEPYNYLQHEHDIQDGRY